MRRCLTRAIQCHPVSSRILNGVWGSSAAPSSNFRGSSLCPSVSQSTEANTGTDMSRRTRTPESRSTLDALNLEQMSQAVAAWLDSGKETITVQAEPFPEALSAEGRATTVALAAGGADGEIANGLGMTSLVFQSRLEGLRFHWSTPDDDRERPRGWLEIAGARTTAELVLVARQRGWSSIFTAADAPLAWS